MASTKVVTGKVRLSYASLFEKRAINEKDTPKYQCMLMIPKTDTKTIDALRAAEAAATEMGKSSKWGGKVPRNLNASIIKDGDVTAEDYPERAGMWTMSVRSDSKPGVVDQNLQPILDPREVYSGCWVRASLNAFAYNGQSNGVSFGLNNVQKLAEGETLGGATRAEEDFAEEYSESSLI